MLLVDSKLIVQKWFKNWESGDYLNLPISDNFKHTSPYGTIKGKKEYLNLVQSNKEKFLDHQFQILDGIFEENKACVRYLATKGDFRLVVSEWYYFLKGEIVEIVAYYNIEEERIKIDKQDN